MFKKKILLVNVLLILCLVFFHKAYAQEKVIKTAWLGEYETFIIWNAMEHGLDKQLDYEIELLSFNSGKEIIDDKKNTDWKIAGLSAIPILPSVLSNKVSIIAIASDEANSNIIYAPEDSEIFSSKPKKSSLKNVFGSPETLKSKHLLSTKGTSAHYTLFSWLKSLGIDPNQMNIQYMNQRVQLGVMKKDFADVYSLWFPSTLEAEKYGLKKLASAKDIQLALPILLVADKSFIEEEPEQVKSFLKFYFQAVDLIKSQPPELLVPSYIRFIKEWKGISINAKEALLSIQNHHVFALQEQEKMFEPKGQLLKWINSIVEFYSATGLIKVDETIPTSLTIENNILKSLLEHEENQD